MKTKAIKKRTVRAKSKKLALSSAKRNVGSYDKDFYNWTLQQTALLEERKFSNLDIANLIEEISCLGRSERDKLESFLTILLMHMLKVTYQPTRHTKSWDLSIKNSKHKAKKILKENPSLKSKLHSLLKEAYFSARLEAAIETGLEEQTFPKECPWKISEIL